MLLGAIADDITGGTDLASVINLRGHRVIQTIGVPTGALPDADVIVISLKTRTAPRDVAIAESLAAASLLNISGAPQLYFKYCSTFDSTPDGNIGPVIEALLEDAGAQITIACPSYPHLRRTVYMGTLFVGDQLLSESPMRNHPLTPMRDANLLRVLAKQTLLPVGLVPLSDVEEGPDRIRRAMARAAKGGVRILIADALFDNHIENLGMASEGMKLVTGGAALGGALVPIAKLSPTPTSEFAPPSNGRAIILSGSCSSATLAQVCRVKTLIPSRAIDPITLAQDRDEIHRLVDWACETTRSGSAMLFSSSSVPEIQRVQAHLGKASSLLVEETFGLVARAVRERGVRTFVVAGGETSGAVLNALGVKMLQFGQTIEPGIPWTYSLKPEGFALALKSGNFGSADFFAKTLGINT